MAERPVQNALDKRFPQISGSGQFRARECRERVKVGVVESTMDRSGEPDNDGENQDGEEGLPTHGSKQRQFHPNGEQSGRMSGTVAACLAG